MPAAPAPQKRASAPSSPPKPGLFAFLLGSLLGLALLKFGNPVILDSMVLAPVDALELIFQPWPLKWGYLCLLLLIPVGCFAASLRPRPPGPLLGVSIGWLGWQLLSSTKTVDAHLTSVTLLHFGACFVLFYLGFFALSREGQLRGLWPGLLAGYLLMLWFGLEQHYGGLEASRKQFYEMPDWQQYPPDYLKKIASDRIFSTLVYPNALAGAILLYFPMLACAAPQLFKRFPRIAVGVVFGLLTYTSAACLIWSGSKSGWLIALALFLVFVLHQPFARQAKMILVGCLLVGGLAGFFIKFSAYFQRGAPSVGARFDYWNAAWSTFRDHPILGTGPGTFSVAYKKIKRPEAEMAKLTHNDFLEQASDSGFVGFASYLLLVLGSLAVFYRSREHLDPSSRLAGLGLLGWALQAFVEFPLYIPALSWPAFVLLGCLWGQISRLGPSALSRRDIRK